MNAYYHHILLAFGYILLCSSVNGQSQYDVIPWKSETTVSNYLIQSVHEQYAKRREAFSNATHSKASLLEYQETLRHNYLLMVGQLPESCSLKAKVTGKIQHRQYSIEKVIYESFKDHHVTANLYLPVGKGPFPAVLLFCGHEPEAKATESYQRTAVLFALNGFVVLVIDPISQGERHQLTDTIGKPLTRGGTTEHTLLNAGSNLVGTSVIAYELRDNQASLEYLLSRSEVDKNKIGCLGNSGGGTQTTYFTPFDKRIKVAAVCSYLASRERNFQLFGANDGCQHLSGEGQFGFEMNDFLIVAAPIPLLILSGRYDFIDFEGTQQSCTQLRNVYKTLGADNKFDLFVYDDGHGISKPKRERVVSWFKRWLQGDDSPVKEPEISVHTINELACTKTGQVNGDFTKEQNVQDYNFKLSQKLKQNRNADSSTITQYIQESLRMDNAAKKIEIEEQVGKELSFQKIIIRKTGEIPVPLLKRNLEGNERKVVIWLSKQGKEALADSSSLMRSLSEKAFMVLLVDLAGFGELSDLENRNESKYYNREYHNAMTAIHLGSHLLAERVKSILAILDYVQSLDKNLRIEIHADGPLALAALHASVIDGRINKLYVSDMITSFNKVIENPMFQDAYSIVIPDVLKYYDVQDLISFSKSTIITL